MSEQTTDITPAPMHTLVPTIIEPIISDTDMAAAMKTYQKLVDLLLDKHDKTIINERPFIRKSGWLKLAVPFNVSTEIQEEAKEKLSDDGKLFAYHFTVRASVPNVRYVEEVGSCDNTEADRPGASAHVVRTMAKTRATSRAIAAIMGKSEQSAEDMDAIPDDQKEKAGAPSSPTEKQLEYIKSLGYKGAAPTTRFDASKIIEGLKEKTKK